MYKMFVWLLLFYVAIYSQPPYGWPASEITIEEVIISDTTVEIVYRQSRGVVWCEGGGPPPYIWKVIYKINNCKLTKDTLIEAKVVLEYTVPEQIVW